MRKRHAPGCPCCGPGHPDWISIPGCPCLLTPPTLAMDSSDPSSNGQILQSATLQYGPTPPGLLSLGINDHAFLSTIQFRDAVTGDLFWYLFTCTSGNYVVTRVYEYSAYGSPYRDIVRYRWPIGFGGNSCDPFQLLAGLIFPGGDPSCVVTVTQWMPPAPGVVQAGITPPPGRAGYGGTVL